MTRLELTKLTCAALNEVGKRAQEVGITPKYLQVLQALMSAKGWQSRAQLGKLTKFDGVEIYSELMLAIERDELVISRQIASSRGGGSKRKEFQLSDDGADKLDYIINGGAKA